MSFSQDKKPKYYKFINGVYYTTRINNNGESDTLIIRRNNGIQTESTLQNGKEEVVMKLKVIWINDSKYILRTTTLLTNSKKPRPSDVICKIIETGDNYYAVKAWQQSTKNKMILRLTTYSNN